MDAPELKAAEAKAKGWFAANKQEALSIGCIALAVGLMIGLFVGYVLR